MRNYFKKNKAFIKRQSFAGLFLTAVFAIVVVCYMVVSYLRTPHGKMAQDLLMGSEKKVVSIAQTERSKPEQFLMVDGNYHRNLIGKTIKIKGVITNSATQTGYNNILITVKYFSKSKTELMSKDVIINKELLPNSSTDFELHIDNLKKVDSIAWKVKDAVSF